MRSRWRFGVVFVFAAMLVRLQAECVAQFADVPRVRVYQNRLTRLKNPKPLLADYPEFVKPITERVRYSAPVLIDEAEADLSVRAWRFSYNARGIIEVPNHLRADRTALIVVHPWGIDDGQGWKTPEPAGAAFQCTPAKNAICRKHVQRVINPLVQSLRSRLKLVAFSLPGREDAVRKQLYRSIRTTPEKQSRLKAQKELEAVLRRFSYHGQRIPQQITLTGKRPITAEYFEKFSGLDASARFNNAGFWNLPIPVMKDIDVASSDVVIYDGDGYAVLRKFLKTQGIRHVLLCGYNTDMCVCTTTAGYQNLRNDFNVFLVGDATLATFPANGRPSAATNAAVSLASLKLLITQISWIKDLPKKTR